MRWPHGDPDAVAHRILAGPAFRTSADSGTGAPGEPWYVTLFRWILHHILEPIFSPIGHVLGSARPEAQVLGFVLIALALGALVFALVRLIVAFAPAPRPAPDLAVRALDDVRSSADWRAVAREAAARGDFRAAIAALFAAALAALDDAALVRFDAARTPGEYRRLVRRARAALSPPFDDLADRFVRATYAQAPPDSEEFEGAQRALAEFSPLVKA